MLLLDPSTQDRLDPGIASSGVALRLLAWGCCWLPYPRVHDQPHVRPSKRKGDIQRDQGSAESPGNPPGRQEHGELSMVQHLAARPSY
jgi:hypothetical protein